MPRTHHRLVAKCETTALFSLYTYMEKETRPISKPGWEGIKRAPRVGGLLDCQRGLMAQGQTSKIWLCIFFGWFGSSATIGSACTCGSNHQACPFRRIHALSPVPGLPVSFHLFVLPASAQEQSSLRALGYTIDSTLLGLTSNTAELCLIKSDWT